MSCPQNFTSNPLGRIAHAALFTACVFLSSTVFINAQCKPADECTDACFMGLSQLNALNSSTNDFFPGFAPGICATSDNDQWILVQAKTNTGTVAVTPGNCVAGDGVQLAIYSACDGLVLDCDPGCNGCGNKEVSVSFNMVPLTLYYIWIDGWSGDGCSFTVKATGFAETLTVSTDAPSTSQSMQVSISPNPFLEKTTIQLTAAPAGEKTLSLFAVDGRLLQTVVFVDDKIELLRNSLPTGLIVFTISKDGAVIASGKLVAE